MSSHKVHVEFPSRILIVGFGSIGQGILPLILRHVGVPPERVSIVTADERGRAVAAEFGVKLICETLTRQSFRRVLNPLLGRGDFLLNVSVDVASIALIKLCWEKGAMYLDTCIEPWPGGYTDPTVPAARRTNLCAARGGVALRPGNARAPTAVAHAWRKPGPRVAPCETGAADIATDTAPTPQPAIARRLGRSCAAPRREGDPHRRARHTGVARAQGAERVRQHLVGRWLRQ